MIQYFVAELKANFQELLFDENLIAKKPSHQIGI